MEPAVPNSGADQITPRKPRTLISRLAELVFWGFLPFALILLAGIVNVALKASDLTLPVLISFGSALAVGVIFLIWPNRRLGLGRARAALLLAIGLMVSAPAAFMASLTPEQRAELDARAEQREVQEAAAREAAREASATAQREAAAAAEQREAEQRRAEADRQEVATNAERERLSAPPPPPPSPWNYSSHTDQMTDRAIQFACTTSVNTVRLDFPYQEQAVELCVRQHPRRGQDVTVRLTRGGQFMCSSYMNCTVRVRFDSGEAAAYSATEAADNSTDVIFISNDTRFVASLRGASRVAIEAQFFQNGAQTMSFRTDELEWPRPQ